MATTLRPSFIKSAALITSFLLGFSTSYAQDRRAAPREDEGRPSKTQPAEKNEKVFSGPQPGESLSEVPVWVTSRDNKPSTKVDLAKLSNESPIVIVFMHEKSRPAFQLGRAMSHFAEKRKDKNLQLYFVVLTEDRSSSEKWLGQIRGYLGDTTELAVADGGIEGPGALGLNRLVAMTILVAKDQKVTANFAMTQVTAAADGPAILAAMNDVSGGGEIPKIDDLLPKPRQRNTR